MAEFARDVLGFDLLPWQRWLMIHGLELRPGGRFRFRTLLVLVARQNGKTSVVEVKNLWKMFVLRVPLVIGTAQNLDIAEESWDKAVEIVESVPELAVEVAHVDRTNGKKALKLTHGSRWKIAAASRRGGRGLSGDDVNLDELREHLDWLAWGAVTKTTMARPNSQTWAYSNAGDDRSVVLNSLQAAGRAAVAHPDDADPTLGHFEWSAPDDVKCTCARSADGPHKAECRLWDRAAWAQANPSLGYTITEQAIASALGTDPEPIFRTEVLCQHVAEMAAEWQVISAGDWTQAEDPRSQMTGRLVFAAAVSIDRSRSAIGVASTRDDGLRHVEVVDSRPGTGWVVPRLVELRQRWNPVAIVLDEFGPTGSLIPDLEKAGVEIERLGTAAVAKAFGQFYDGVCGDPEARLTRHRGQDELTSAVAGAAKRSLGEGSAWDRRTASVDLTPLVAVTNALYGLVSIVPEQSQPFFAAWR